MTTLADVVHYRGIHGVNMSTQMRAETAERMRVLKASIDRQRSRLDPRVAWLR